MNLKRFPIESIPYDFTMLLVAKRNTGKSFLIRDIMSYFKDIPVGMLMSHSEEMSPFFIENIPDEFIYYDFDPTVLDGLMRRQKKWIEKFGKDSWKTGGPDSRAFLIMDDMISEAKTFFRDKSIKEIFFNGRHYNLMFIMTTQDCMLIDSKARTNLDYIFLLKENRLNILQKLYNHYAGIFPSFELFRECMMKFTEDYGCLVISNKSKSSKLEDNVFWYKAGIHPNLKLMGKKAWKFHDKYYNENWKENPVEIEKPFFDKKSKTTIKIKKAEDIDSDDE